MATTTGADDILKPLYVALYEAFEEEDYEAAIAAADKILKSAPQSLEARAAKTTAALHTGNYPLALTSALPEQELEKAYAHYKLGQGKEALALLNQSGHKEEEAYRHLRGQVCFKEGMFDEAASVFASLVEEGGDEAKEDVELMTNLYAAFVAAKRGKEVLERFPIVGDGLMESCFELAFNSGTALIDAGELQAAEKRLREAQAVCLRVAEEEEMTANEVLDESSVILLELAYVLSCRGGSGSGGGKKGEAFDLLTSLVNKGGKISDPVVRLLAINNAAALSVGRHMHKDMSSTLKKMGAVWGEAEGKLLPGQVVVLSVNRALMLLQSGKVSEAKEALAGIAKKSKSTNGDEDTAWRVQMVEIAIKMKEAENTHTYTPDADLRTLLTQVQKTQNKEGEQTVGTALAQLLVDTGKLAEAASVLESLSSLKGYPAHVATLASIYAKLGQDAKSLGVFNEALTHTHTHPTTLPAEAQVKLLQGAAAVRAAYGDHKGAAEALKSLLHMDDDNDTHTHTQELESDDRLRALAALVIATSWFNVEDAQSLSSSLPPTSSSLSPSPLSADTLEKTGLPRASTTAARRLSTTTTTTTKEKSQPLTSTTTTTTTKPKNLDKIKRKRAKARLAYLQSLTAAGKYDPNRPGPPPDPERWIAKSQRSYNKRGKKGRNKFVGAQGSGDGAQKDAVKLDVASRVAAQKKAGLADAGAGGGDGGGGTGGKGRRKKK